MYRNMNEFKEFVRERIQERFPNKEIMFQKMKSMDRTYNGMVVGLEEGKGTPVINLDEYYNSDMSDEEKIEQMVRTIKEFKQPLSVDSFMDYNKVRENLFIRLWNKENDMLASVPHSIVHDLAVTCHVFVEEKLNGDIATFTVKNDMLELWNVSKEKILKDAMLQAPNVFPLNIMEMKNIFSVPDVDVDIPEMYIITNSHKLNGASAILYPNTLKDLYNKIGSFYILPSSIHEVICVPDKNANLESLKSTVKDANETVVTQEEKLSDNVYYFNGEELSVS